MKVQYEELVDAYWKNLTTVLRSFSVGEDWQFLDSWVPDDDSARGILGILEAAQRAGLESITITLGRRTLNDLDFDDLHSTASRFGSVEFERLDSELNLSVSLSRQADSQTMRAKVKGPSAAASISPKNDDPARQMLDGNLPADYAQTLGDIVRDFRHSKKMEPERNLELVTSSCSGIELAALIDPATLKIEKIHYRGGSSDEHRMLLELLCRLSEGRPLQEASDHAVINMHHALARGKSRPVPGIAMPENVSLAFEVPTQLIRDLMKACSKLRVRKDTRNFYDAPCSPHWRQLSERDRIARIREAISEHPAGHGIRVVGLDGFQRFIVESDSPLPNGSCLLDLERHVKMIVEPTLHLYLQPQVDRNKIRRLNDRSLQDQSRE